MRRLFGSLGLLPILLLLLAPSVLAAPPANPFNGSWEAIDPGDGSNLDLHVRGGRHHVAFALADDDATAACAGASTSRFVAFGNGRVDGSEMHTTIRLALCGKQVRPFLHGMETSWYLDDGGNADPSDDVLFNTFGEEYWRAN